MSEAIDEAVKAAGSRTREQAEELMELVRIRSVSAAPEHRADIDRAADRLAARLRRAGVPDVRVMPTKGHPVVVGLWHHAPRAPTVIVYGHYDVQPPEPLELWETPPFEPQLRDGKVYGRGASDDKGGVLIALHAVEASAAATGAPP